MSFSVRYPDRERLSRTLGELVHAPGGEYPNEVAQQFTRELRRTTHVLTGELLGSIGVRENEAGYGINYPQPQGKLDAPWNQEAFREAEEGLERHVQLEGERDLQQFLNQIERGV